jgi:hypothetical protein
MRIIFGVLTLLIALAIVGTLAKKQLQALGQIGGTTSTRAPADPDAKAVTVAVPGAMGGMADAAPAVAGSTVPMQVQSIQNNVRSATEAALQKGSDRNNGAQP